ncbi:30S ribosomal protein S8e [archaeon SCG-AAA382B04]|nr:30S ribosomal protein S8e [archaeon SCG-AAA382B04]
MVKNHGRSKRNSTGGRLTRHQKKKKHELGREKIDTEIGEKKKKKIRTRGGDQKVITLQTDEVNVSDPEKNETTEAKIENVLENEANPHYVRRNIITKGAIIQTSEGKAKVTNRPGQEGTVNAVLLKK